VQELPPSLVAGQRVLVRDESWIVVHTEAFGAVRVVRLRGAHGVNAGRERSFLAPFDVFEPVAAATRLRQASRSRVLAAATAAAACAGRWTQSWTAAQARIDVRPWQFEPAIAAVGGATRIFLADAVGLGKTIQALLIVSELVARGLAERVLVLTPPSLRHQWAAEMRERFSLAATVFDQASLNASAAALPPDVNPWESAAIAIASLDLVKRPDIRAAVDNASFDVLIVDEAHHVTAGTDRGAVVADLAARTPWVVLVSATPHSGDDAAFAFLTSLGGAGGGPPRIFNRSAPAARLSRRSRIMAITPTAAERSLLLATADYTHALRRSRRHSQGTVLLASVIARRAASSAAALARTVQRRIALLSGECQPEEQAALPWDEGDAQDDGANDALLSASGLLDQRGEIRCLEQIATLAAAAAARPSKIAFLHRLLRRTNEQLLVFSEYRDVVQVVVAALRGIAPVAALHGEMSEPERRETIHAFNRGAIRTLVATDAAGEGLNLHHRCRLVVNMELPWMPRRLEQRVGRVDRLGQRRRVHAIHLVHRESFESTVLARLERRRAALRARAAMTAIDSRSDRADASRRMLAFAAHDTPARNGALFVAARRHGSTRALMLVFGASLLDGGERFVNRLVVGVRVKLSARAGSHTAFTRRGLRAIVADPRLASAIHAELDRLRAHDEADASRTGKALADRLDHCLRAVARRGGGGWQGSLFDHRAEIEAHAHADARLRMCERLERTLRVAVALQTLTVTPPDLLAAWPDDSSC
jgi:superfamily II DNA or RNA helicase